jgi:hypothetical protein
LAAAACEAASSALSPAWPGLLMNATLRRSGMTPVSASTRLPDQLERHHADAGEVAARPGQAVDDPAGDRIAAEREHDRQLRAAAPDVVEDRPLGHDHIGLRAKQVGHDRIEAIGRVLAPVHLEAEVAVLDAPDLGEPEPQRGEKRRSRVALRARHERDARRTRAARRALRRRLRVRAGQHAETCGSATDEVPAPDRSHALPFAGSRRWASLGCAPAPTRE